MKAHKILFIIIGSLYILVMLASNPSLQEHIKAVNDKMQEYMQADHTNNKWKQLGNETGMEIKENIIEQFVQRDNYLLFSVTYLYNAKTREKKYIGLGLFDKVWIFDDTEK